MDKSVNIIKYSGEAVPFNSKKLVNSLLRAHASEALIQQIVDQVENQIHDGMTTKKIYQMAFKMLKDTSRVSASKYKLKKALMELGPTGFPFEKLVGELMGREGYSTQVSVIVEGNCVRHEVDVIAQKGNEHYMIECKYHSDQGRFCNVKTPLYIHSRFLDVEKQWVRLKGHGAKLHKGGVYTNTRLTTDAIQYGQCIGLLLCSWDHPKGNGLKDRIDRSGLHPLTALTTLTKGEKTKLLDKGIVLCKDIYESPMLLDSIGVPKSRHNNILEDSRELCKTHTYEQR